MSYREEWKEVKLGDVSDVTTGFPFKSKFYSLEDGIRVVRGENVSLGYLKWNTTKYWNKPFKDKEKYSLKDKDIVIGMDGSRVGRNKTQVRSSDLPLLLAQRVALVRSYENYNQDYIAYIIKSNFFQRYVERIKTGTSIPHISKSQIENFEFTIPENLEIQNRIAYILFAFDEKIEVNRQMNATLEAMAQAMFREMCLPDDEENLEDGWEWQKIGDLALVNKGTRGKNFSYNEIEYFDTSSVTKNNFSLPANLETDKAPSRAKRLVQHKDIIYSSVRPNQEHYGMVYHPNKYTVVSTGFVVIRPKQNVHHLLYSFLTEPQTIEYLHSIAESSTSTYPSIKPDVIKDLKIAIPPNPILKAFEEQLSEFYEKIHFNNVQNQALAKSRDLLLPKLMSGEIEV